MTLQKNKSAVRRFAKMMKFGAWLQNLPNKITPPPFRLLQIESAFWQSRALYVAARLDIASALGDKILPIEIIAQKVSAHPDGIYRLMRMLAAMGVFEQVSPGQFRNNKLSDCLREDSPHTVRAMVLMHNSEEMSRPWYEQLEQGIRSGNVPFQLAHGDELFDFMDKHPEFDALFSRAMDSVEALAGDAYATDFDWGRFNHLVDVGGSRGSKSVAILKRHPKLTALVVDRPQVIEEAQRYWQERKSEEPTLARMRFQPGDVLESLPPAQSERDIYLLSAVLHGFDDKTAIQALKTVAGATRQRGACIALIEMVMSEDRPDYTSTSFDMQMFIGTRGRERTLREWQHVFDESGVVLQEVVGMRSFGNILVLRA